MRAAFGEEIQIRKDMELGHIAEVRKDSEDYHKTNLYKLTLLNKGSFEMEYKELSGEKLVEDKAAYQAQRLESIVASLIDYIQTTNDVNTTILKEVPFTQAIYLLASPLELHPDDKNYLTPNFISNNLKAVYAKIGIEIFKDTEKSYKVFMVKDIDITKTSPARKKIIITTAVQELLANKVIKDVTSVIKSAYDIKDLEEELLTVLSNGSKTGEELRIATYKSKDVHPTKYSKNFAKDNLGKAIDNLLEAKQITLTTEGRKKTYTSVQALED